MFSPSFHVPDLVVFKISIPTAFQLPEFSSVGDRPTFVSDSIRAIFLENETPFFKWYHIVTSWPGAVSENSLEIWANEYQKAAHSKEAFEVI
jgi:hypothetical protein